jgi:hypothetical protein
MNTALEGGEGSASRSGRSLPPEKTRYSLYRRLGGPQCRSGQVRKISPPTGIRSTDRPAHSQSLYRLRYPTHAVYGIKRKNTLEPDRRQMIILRMLIACCITKTASTRCTPRICKIYCFSIATMVYKRTCFTLYIYCLSSFFSRKVGDIVLVYSSRK